MQLTVLIPCFNEEKRLDIRAFSDYLSRPGNSTRFVFINDGSSDKTGELLDRFHKTFPESTYVLHLSRNRGKADAVRQGMLWLLKEKLTCDYAGFMDADLSTPLSELTTAIDALNKFGHPAMAFGSRLKLFGSTRIQRSLVRHLVGRIIATLISGILKLPIYDTQCGFKFFRKDVIGELFTAPFISRWIFDVEIIFRLLGKTGYDRISKELFEFPVLQWTETGNSKIPVSYAFRLPFELIRIRMKYR